MLRVAVAAHRLSAEMQLLALAAETVEAVQLRQFLEVLPHTRVAAVAAAQPQVAAVQAVQA